MCETAGWAKNKDGNGGRDVVMGSDENADTSNHDRVDEITHGGISERTLMV